MRGFLAGAALALALALVPITFLRAAPPVTWRVERVDAASERPWLALDRAGQPHVAYGAVGTIRYARREDAGWRAETVAPGNLPVLALDAADQPHVVYSDFRSVARAMRYARKVGGTWTTEEIEALPARNEYPFYSHGMAVGPDGSVHVVYWQDFFAANGSAVKYARRDTAGRWTVEVIGSGENFGDYHALALDAGGVPHVSIGYAYGGWIRYARRDAGGWTIETASQTSGGKDNAIALDPAGRPRIAYFEAGGGNLMDAARSEAGWTTELAVDEPYEAGRNPALVIDRTGEPRILSHGESGLEHVRREGSRWVVQVVDTRGTVPSLVIDPAGAPRAAYLADGEVRYATGTVLGLRSFLPLVPQRAGA